MGRLESKSISVLSVSAASFSVSSIGIRVPQNGDNGVDSTSLRRKDLRECGHLLLRAICIGITSTGLLFILQWQLIDFSFLLIDTSSDVEHLARVYFHIRIYAAPATRVSTHFTGSFRVAKCTLSDGPDSCGESHQRRFESRICAAARYEGRGGRFGRPLSHNISGCSWQFYFFGDTIAVS